MTLNRNSKLITRKFIQYLIPSILMIFAMQFGSLVDGIFVGNFLGAKALTASSLIMPILYIIQIPGFALGIGGATVVANLLGRRDVVGAKRAFSISIIVGMGISLLFMILGFFIARPLAGLFSTDPEIIEYSYQYIFIYFITDPIISFALLIGNFMAVDNNPRLSGAFFIVGNIFKVGSELLFITIIPMGMYGAALSTGVGYFIGLFTIIIYMKNKKRLLSFTFIVKNAHFKEVLKASSTTILNFALTAVQMLIINMVIGQKITDPNEIVIFGLIANMVFVFDLFCGGIVNIIPNICGILYGEKDYYSLKSITRKIYIINLGVTVFFTVFIMIFPNIYSMIFGYGDVGGDPTVAPILRIYLLSFIPYEISKFSMNYYPSIDHISPSIVTVLLREAIIVLPLTLCLFLSMGLMGYSIASAITEAATVVITYIYIFIYQRIKKDTKGIFMLEKVDYEKLELTLTNDLENASNVSKELTSFALEHHIKERNAQVIGLASEEIVNNIVTYGYKKGRQNYIDVILKIMKDKMVLSIRDDGMPFDPTKYDYDNDEEYNLSGIRLIEKLTDKMSYIRLLNLNNTVFEINL